MIAAFEREWGPAAQQDQDELAAAKATSAPEQRGPLMRTREGGLHVYLQFCTAIARTTGDGMDRLRITASSKRCVSIINVCVCIYICTIYMEYVVKLPLS